MTWWHPAGDVAASEVVGYVLITGISVLAITIVLLTSGPALDEVQSAQQHDSMLGYFNDLDQGISLLLSGSPAGSTPVWRVSMSTGSVTLDKGPQHMWAFSTDQEDDGGLVFRDFADDDNTFVAKEYGSPGISSLTVEPTLWEGSEDSDLDATVSGPSSGEWEISISHANNGPPAPLEGKSIQVRFYDGDATKENLVSVAWFIDAAAVEWQRNGAQQQRVLYQNTAIMGLRDDGQVIHNQPRIQPPDTSGGQNEEHIFVRIVKFDGAVSVAGRTTAQILISSEGNHPRLSKPDVARVQIYPPAGTATAWERFFTNENFDYTFTWDADPTNVGSGTPEPVAFRDRSDNSLDELSTTMVETDIQLTHQGGV